MPTYTAQFYFPPSTYHLKKIDCTLYSHMFNSVEYYTRHYCQNVINY